MQVNEDELATLAGSWGDAWQFAAGALHEGVLLVLVTLGGEGAVYFAESELPRDPLQWRTRRTAAVQRIAPARTGRIRVESGPLQGDPTGCGDVWGSTLFAGLLTGEPVESAIRQAHRTAARNLTHHGASGLVAHLRGELHAPSS
jgi:sugar/nucleoside kinase (ribokinase family)